MSLTIDEVRHIAFLARLELTPDEQERYTVQLSAVLEYASRLQQVDTSDIPPTATVLPLFAPLREDAVRDSMPRDNILANAFKTAAGMFQVPPILDDDAHNSNAQREP